MSTENYMVGDIPFPKSYAQKMLLLDSGKGSYLFDAGNMEYLDFGSGIAVNSLGHGREDLATLAYGQMKKLIHTSNLYTTAPVIDLARRLTSSGNFEAAFFGNSGTEANEAALKFSRLYAYRTKGKGHHKIAYFTNAFHGRTMGALSCTPKEKYQKPFLPLVPDTVLLPYNDSEAVKNTLDTSFAAVIVEPLQGEGGLFGMSTEFAETLNTVCRENDIILIADEVQTGLGRTGTLFGSENYGVEPDIITLAKPLGGGLPLSATLLPEKVNTLLKAGEHASTFGGNPVSSVVACRVWDEISNIDFLKAVHEKGILLEDKLNTIKQTFKAVSEVRGRGLLQGIVVEPEGKDGAETVAAVRAEAQKRGLLVLACGENVIRIAPPLIIKQDEIQKGIDILEEALRAVL